MPTASKQTSKETTYSYQPPISENLVDEFKQTHRSYILFNQKGMDKLPFREGQTVTEGILDNGLFKWMLRFLNDVDTAKGPIQRHIARMERRRDLDLELHGNVEHLVVHTRWIAKDFNGNELKSPSMLEGLYNEPVTRTEIVNGKRVQNYVNWVARYDIPFSPKAVDDAIENNLNPPESINYFCRTARTNRDDTYSLEQFRDSTWEEVLEINRKGTGANR